MPSILSHPAIPIALACVAGQKKISPSLLAAGIFASALPDIDVIGFKFGVPYDHLFGHRGFFHSLLFSLLCASLGILVSRKFGARPIVTFFFLFFSMASHGLLDAATNGGLGIAFFSPFSNHRYFFPWHPIAVVSLSATRFFTLQFKSVMLSEAKWVWLPCISVGSIGLMARRLRGGKPSDIMSRPTSGHARGES